MTRRVVVTGIGAVTPLGNKHELWEHVLTGVSGAGPITHFDASDFPVRIACEVKNFDPTNYMEKKEGKADGPLLSVRRCSCSGSTCRF